MVTMTYSPAARGVCVLAVAGEFDDTDAAVLRTGLVDALGSKGPRLVLDLRSMDGCGSAGVRAIGDAASRASRRGGWLRVVAEPRLALSIAPPHSAAGQIVFGSIPDAVSTR